MALNYVRFFSLLFVALALAPSAAHLLELPTKLALSRDDYLTVQQIALVTCFIPPKVLMWRCYSGMDRSSVT